MKRRRAFLAVLGFGLCISWCPRGANSGQFDRVVVFGDSLSDTGNVFQFSQGTFPPSTPPGLLYDSGRFSNGPVWVEYLADAIGAPLPTPSLLGGTNFAWGGAQSGVSFEPYDSTLDPDPFPLSSTLSIRDQVGTFLLGVAGGGAPNPDDTLYIVWGGANDFLIGNEQVPGVAVENIRASVDDLIDFAGAAHLLVPNMPPLVDTPGVGGGFDSAFVAEDQPSKLGKLVDKFNTKLSETLVKIATKNTDVNIYEFDVFSLYQQVVSDPEGNGFNPNTGIPVLNESVLYGNAPGPLFLNDPASSLFFDSEHPTTLAHSRLAEEAANLLNPTTSLSASISAVPEPSAVLLIVMGSLVLLGRRGAR